LWLIKHWFSASTFVLKIATFAKPKNVVCLESYNTHTFVWWMSAENYMEAKKWIDLPHRAVKSTVQTALCCIWGNSFVVKDKVKNGDNDLCR
jgi:hypothetical protein